uniref:Uncharacterized protein n=1 Tax=Strigops habroptila TaxID=2489341 RepID=A0A672TK87_STRHB
MRAQWSHVPPHRSHPSPLSFHLWLIIHEDFGRTKTGASFSKSQYLLEVSGDSMYNIRRSTVCHLACHGKVKNISGLIYVKTCGVLKVFWKNMIQDDITHSNEHDKKGWTFHSFYCMEKNKRAPPT